MTELFKPFLISFYNDVPTAVYEGLLSVFCFTFVFCLVIEDAKRMCRLFSIISLVAYLLLIFSSTLFFRKYVETRDYNFMPFWTYKAIEEGKISFIAEIIFNVAVFVPVGALLGCAFRSMTWWKVLLIGGCVSGTIETMQFVYKRGFAETDDVIHNTIGCMLGYGVYKLVRYGYERIGKGNMEVL